MLLLDASSGNRMMWKNKSPPLTVFMDSQIKLQKPPDIFGCWEHTPFRDKIFLAIIFDPPHKFNRSSGFWADPTSSNYYGADIRREKLVSGIYHGTREFLRIAQRLCFKWCDDEISLWRILGLLPKEWKEIYRKGDDRVRAHGNTTWWITFINGVRKVIIVSETNQLTPKQFRTEVGREIRRMRKLQKEHWSNGRRYYLRVLRVTYDMLGIDAEKKKIIQSNPKLWEETKIYLKGIIDWCEFLLMIQPNPPKNTKWVDTEQNSRAM